MTPPDIERAFAGAVTVGERGQVVIPASVREERGIQPGDKLLVFHHPEGHGILFLKVQDLQQMAEDLQRMAAFIAPSLNGTATQEAAEVGPGTSQGTANAPEGGS